MNHVAKEMALARPIEKDGAVPAQVTSLSRTQKLTNDQAESLFERFAWLYIFCREKLFRDDTKRIISALWPEGRPDEKAKLIELGCGPGFYSCRLAARYPGLS